jgi:hypothetical protein
VSWAFHYKGKHAMGEWYYVSSSISSLYDIDILKVETIEHYNNELVLCTCGIRKFRTQKKNIYTPRAKAEQALKLLVEGYIQEVNHTLQEVLEG